MSYTDNRRQGIRIHPKNQVQYGVHATLIGEDRLGEGDTITPTSERYGASTNSSLSNDSKTYFAPIENAQMTTSFIERQREDAEYHGRSPNPARFLITAPSQDQHYDPNYLRSSLEAGLFKAQHRTNAQGVSDPSPTPIRDAIDHARANAPRTSSSQRVVQSGNSPVPSGNVTHTSPALPGIDWHKYGHANYKSHYTNGDTFDSRGVYTQNPDNLREYEQERTHPREPDIPGQMQFPGMEDAPRILFG